MRAWLPLFLLVPGVASATSGLAWKLPIGQVDRYVLESRMLLSEPMILRAVDNIDVRVSEVWLDMVVACKVIEPAGKSAVELNCDIETASLAAAPLATDANRDLGAVLNEMKAQLEAGYLQMEFTMDGRVRNLDLEDVPKTNQRQAYITEILRLLCQRSLAGLDLQLPKKGDDGGAGKWKADQSLAMGLPALRGVLGNTQTTWTIAGTDGGVVNLTSTGRGTLGSGDMVNINGIEQPRNLYDMNLEGSARFDVTNGRLLEQRYTVTGDPTASSIINEGSKGVRYIQGASLVWLAPDAAIPSLPANQVMPVGGSLKAATEPPPAP